jgi:hypothetical protein
VLSPADLEHFADRGYVRVGGAFTSVQAAAMRDVVWEALARDGVFRDDPSTWTVEAPSHLQHLKRNPVFDAVGSERTIAAIDQLLGAGQWRRPADWGAFFLMFPTSRVWNVAVRSWHVDHDYLDPQVPLSELKVHALFGDIEPRAGGMHVLAGSHHVVAGYFARHPAAPGSSGARLRKSLMASHPYLVALETDGEPAARITRFMERDEEIDGVRVRVVELTATAGDVVLMHPLLLHSRPTNAGRAPRFLLNKDLYRCGAAALSGIS